MRIIHIIGRWIQLLTYAFLGSVFLAYVGPRLGDWATDQFEKVCRDNATAVAVISGIVLLFALAAIHRFADFRLAQARWLTFPPLPAAIIIAVVTAPYWPDFSKFGSRVDRVDSEASHFVAVLYGALWLVQVAFVATVNKTKKRVRERQSRTMATPRSRRLEDFTDDELAQWLRREQPIVHPDQDLFDFWEFTERVISKLGIVGTTIALQGGFGAGKTSFIHLLEKRAELRRQRLYFVRVSCWGFEETVAAQKNLLSGLVRRVNAEVDCLSIRTLPKEYVSIVSKKLEWLNLLTSIDESPVEQLQRLTPILSSIAGQVVVVVEDVDRTGQKFDVSTGVRSSGAISRSRVFVIYPGDFTWSVCGLCQIMRVH